MLGNNKGTAEIIVIGAGVTVAYIVIKVIGAILTAVGLQ